MLGIFNKNYRIIKKSKLFDAKYYLLTYPDVRKAGIDPLKHFIEYGWKEGRNPSTLFNTSFYLNTYPDVREAKINPLLHYIRDGKTESKDTSYFSSYRKFIKSPQPSIDSYFLWYNRFVKLSQSSITRMKAACENFKYKPKFSILVFGENSNVSIASIYRQSYQVFEILRIGDYEDKILDSDNNIKFTTNGRLKENLGIITGDYVIFINSSDTISPDALFNFVIELNMHSDKQLDVIYSDHDYSEDIYHINPFFKPDWSPDLFLVNNYIQNACCIKSQIVRKNIKIELKDPILIIYSILLQGFQHYSIIHIPYILFSLHNNKDIKAAGQELDLRKTILEKDGICVSTNSYNVPCIKRNLNHYPKVSIVIPTCFKNGCIKRLLESLFSKTTYPNFEVLILVNQVIGSNSHRLDKYINKIKLINITDPFNWAKINNYGTKCSTGDIYLFLNDDVIVLSNDWLEILVAETIRPEIGVVGPLMLFPDGLVQHAGIMSISRGGGAIHLFYKCQEQYVI